MTPKAKTADLLPDDHKPPSPEQLDTMRDAMCAAIEARDVAAIERVFLWAHQILTDAQVLELRYKREKDVESQRRYWEIELGVERLRARWLIDTKKAGLRYDPRRSKVKFGAPTPHLISLDAAGQPPRIGIDRKKSQQLQAFAKLSEKQFKAELADKTMPTVAGIIRRYAKPTTAGHRSPPSPAIVADVDDRPIQINAPDADDEDESLLHSLDTPDLDSLPGISTDELREKRKQAITQMQADRTAMRAPTDPDPAAHDRGRPVLRLVHSVTASHIEEPPSPTPAPIITIEEEEAPPPIQPVVKMEEQRSVPYVSSAPMAEIEVANLSATLALASAGVPVFPARLDRNAEAKKWDKRPAITGWKKAATTDLEQIRAWWRKLPLRLGLPAHRLVPGIWCGHPTLDWVVVDADRHGGPDGVSAFHALVAEPGNELPAGPRTITAGSGVHSVFRQPPGKTKFGNSKGELPGGIDIRGVDGWIVGPGAMRPDGAMWRTADGSPSLVEAYRNGIIPIIPPWLADLIRAPKPRKERTPKNKTEAKEAKPSPSTASIPSDKTATKREKAWARGALNNIVEKLAAMPSNSGRNEFTYRKAFVMGAMVCRGWIDQRTVESEMLGACEKNGLVAEGDDVRGAIERGLKDGSGCPHHDLPDRRTKAARQQRDSTKAWKNLLPTEIYRLLRVRPGGEFATDDAAKDVLAAIRRDGHVIEKLNRLQLGDLLGVTFAEFKAIGAMFDRHPSRFLPCDATREEVDAHLAAVRKAKNPARAQAARERRAHKKLEREQQPPTNELVAQRCAALVAYAKRHPGKHKTGDLVCGLKRWDAFEGITDKTRRNVIDELLKLAVSGKLPALTEFLIVTKQTATNRKPTFTIEYRK